MSMFTTAKATSDEMRKLIEKFIIENGVIRAEKGRAKGSRSEGSKHKGKASYMRGNRRAA